jgi:hypothetical protein
MHDCGYCLAANKCLRLVCICGRPRPGGLRVRGSGRGFRVASNRPVNCGYGRSLGIAGQGHEHRNPHRRGERCCLSDLQERNGLKRIATKLKIVDSPPDVVVQMKPATARVHAINLSAQSKAVASLMAVPTVSRAAPSALEELLAWYLRIASS